MLTQIEASVFEPAFLDAGDDVRHRLCQNDAADVVLLPGVELDQVRLELVDSAAHAVTDRCRRSRISSEDLGSHGTLTWRYASLVGRFAEEPRLAVSNC